MYSEDMAAACVFLMENTDIQQINSFTKEPIDPKDPRKIHFVNIGTGQEIPGFDGEQTGEEDQWLERVPGTGEAQAPCPACHGARLNPEALAVRFRGRSIAELSALSVAEENLEGGDAELSLHIVSNLLEKGDEALEGERQAHERTKSDVREAQAFAAERAAPPVQPGPSAWAMRRSTWLRSRIS